MTPVKAVGNRLKYARLLTQVMPHIIHSEEENERYTATLEALLTKRHRKPEEDLMVELLTLLIEDFEEKNYAIPAAPPREIVRHLMESNGLRQAELTDIFGAESTVSEVLSGKRDLAKSHIERLSRRFNISPALFFESRSKARPR